MDIALAPAAPSKAAATAATTRAPDPERPLSIAFYRHAREQLLAGLAQPSGALIVTPNLDHLRLLNRSAALRRAYRAADVVLNDSRFLDRLCLNGTVLTLPGSELAPLMLDRAPRGAAALVIGCDAAIKADLTRRYPHIRFAFVEPSMGFIRRRSERRALTRMALDTAPAMIFVCTGAPQSELLAAQMKRAGVQADILCCGSAFHFLAGTKARAPVSTRDLGLEWAWRFVLEPRTRRRYLTDAAFLMRNARAFLTLSICGQARFSRYRIALQL